MSEAGLVFSKLRPETAAGTTPPPPCHCDGKSHVGRVVCMFHFCLEPAQEVLYVHLRATASAHAPTPAHLALGPGPVQQSGQRQCHTLKRDWRHLLCHFPSKTILAPAGGGLAVSFVHVGDTHDLTRRLA